MQSRSRASPTTLLSIDEHVLRNNSKNCFCTLPSGQRTPDEATSALSLSLSNVLYDDYFYFICQTRREVGTAA